MVRASDLTVWIRTMLIQPDLNLLEKGNGQTGDFLWRSQVSVKMWAQHLEAEHLYRDLDYSRTRGGGLYWSEPA